MVLATDEVYTYAIFNYGVINWSSHTEAGGDTTHGEGGIPAFVSVYLPWNGIFTFLPAFCRAFWYLARLWSFDPFKSCIFIGFISVSFVFQVGFNAGNGTQSYEYMPYSQNMVIRDLTGRGWANGFPGRHIFRIDERILIGSCNKDIGNCFYKLLHTNYLISRFRFISYFCRCLSFTADFCSGIGKYVGRHGGQYNWTLLWTERSSYVPFRHWRCARPLYRSESRNLHSAISQGRGLHPLWNLRW